MTIRTLTDTGTLIGLSTDTKPLTAADGTIFKETDTGKKFFFDLVNLTWVPEFEPISLSTLISGEDQANDCLVVEEQNGYDTFDKATGAVDVVLGSTGASGDLLVRVRVTIGIAGTVLNIYDGDVATGTLVLSIPFNTGVGTTFECGFLSKNGGFTCEDDASIGAVIAVGRFS